jgi:hypothetical protein
MPGYPLGQKEHLYRILFSEIFYFFIRDLLAETFFI